MPLANLGQHPPGQRARRRRAGKSAHEQQILVQRVDLRMRSQPDGAKLREEQALLALRVPAEYMAQRPQMLDRWKGLRRHGPLQGCPTRSKTSTPLPIISRNGRRQPSRPSPRSGNAWLRLAVRPPMWYLSFWPHDQEAVSVHLRYHDAREIAVARRAATAIAALMALPLMAFLGACSDKPPPGYQGYVEGEFVNVASPIAGRLDHLSVKRGDEVAVNARLFALEAVNEAAAQRQAAGAAESGRGAARRPEARQARAGAGRHARAARAGAGATSRSSATQLARDEAQFEIGGIARAQLDDSRAAHAANVARVRELASELAVAQLPAADEQIHAQAAQVAAARAALEQATWRLDQKPVAGHARGPRVRHALPRRRMGGRRQPGRADAAAAERQGALLRAGDASSAASSPGARRDPLRRLRRRRPGDGELRLDRGRVHAAGHLQQRDARQARVHGRGAARGRERARGCIRASRSACALQ